MSNGHPTKTTSAYAAPADMLPSLPQFKAIRSFRAHYRATDVPHGYSPQRHFATIVGVCVAIVCAAVSMVHDLHWLELTIVPATIVAANLVEYHAHRGPMHHPIRGLRPVYLRHVHKHHRFFRRIAMSTETPKDAKVVFFPLVLLIFFFGVIALPLAAVVLVFLGLNCALLFCATVAIYYLAYECVHAACHAGSTARLRRLPVIAAMAAYHRRHHDPRHMNRCNFNITFPLADLIYGTARLHDDG